MGKTVKKSIDKPIKSLLNERPTVYADKLGTQYIQQQHVKHIKSYGQYLTPPAIADYMASMFVFNSTRSDAGILEPGAGTGILSCALCEKLADATRKPKIINLVVYELDNYVIPYLNNSLKYLSAWLKQRDVNLTYQILSDDFILKNAHTLENDGLLLGQKETKLFDFAIANPPYFKITKSDPRAIAAAKVVHGQPNIYALFMAIAAKLLKQNGQMVFITPRSFTAGSYFKLFREKFFSWVRPVAIHLFESRKKAFDRDKVLQENVILKAERQDNWQQRDNAQSTVHISSSQGLGDLSLAELSTVPLADVLNVYSKDKILHIPLHTNNKNTMVLVRSWKHTLHSHGLEVSTGPIVSFRAAHFLSQDGRLADGFAPLLLIHNVIAMQMNWPIQKSDKPQFIIVSPQSGPLLLPNKNYVLLRRFSAKEERRRLVASPYLAKQTSSRWLGLENHLNYIYRPYGELLPEEAYGLSALFNSEILDDYFRTFNGNTQVNASELRNLPLPDMGLIKEVGKKIMTEAAGNQAEPLAADQSLKVLLQNH